MPTQLSAGPNAASGKKTIVLPRLFVRPAVLRLGTAFGFAAAFARGFGASAGVLLGYAVLTRMFPLLFLVPLGIKWLQNALRRTRDETLARCIGCAIGLVLVVGVGLVAVGEENSFLREFVSKIRFHSEAPFTNHVGLGSLFVFASAPWSAQTDGSVYVAHDAAVAARPAPYVLPLASGLYLLAALPLILRARPLESVMYAVPLIFCALSPAGYYYSFLVLLVLLPWQRGSTDSARLIGMALLAVVTAVSYAFELASDELFPLFYQASIQMGLFFLFWLGFEYARLGARGRGLSTVVVSPPGERGAKRPSV